MYSSLIPRTILSFIFCLLILPPALNEKHLTKLRLDESKCLLSVLSPITLMSSGIVSSAAVWVCGIAIRLDLAAIGAHVTLWMSCELAVVSNIRAEAEAERKDIPLAFGKCQHCMKAQRRFRGRP